MFDELRGYFGIQDAGGRLAIAENYIIDHRESGHQFGPRALRQQRLGWIGNFDYQEFAPNLVLAEAADMLGQQWIEIA